MKKSFLPFCFALVLLSGCVSTEVESDVDDLKARVEALEKSKSVIGVTFNETQMVLTYSTSETQTLDMPSGLNGLNGTDGANGADGNGIKSITYNETTSVLTIVLANGSESQFRIITNGEQGLAAVMISDINGSMYVSEVTMGAVPIASVSYDANFNITSMLSQSVVDGAILKNFDITKQYTGGLLTNLQTRNYALKKEVKYVTEYYDLNQDGLPDDFEKIVKDVVVVKSSSYNVNLSDDDQLVPNQDGSYTLTYYTGSYNSYDYEWNDTEQLYIHTFTDVCYVKCSHVIRKTFASDSEYRWWDFYEKEGENTVIHYYRIKEKSEEVDGAMNFIVYYARNCKYTKVGTYNIGDVISTQNRQIECNAAGLPVKMYSTVEGAVSPTRYVQLTYNAGGLATRADEYNKMGDAWVVNPVYLTFEYNDSKLLTSVKRNDGNGKADEVFKNVYDKNGNPVEIYAWGGEIKSHYYYLDPLVGMNNTWPSDWINEEKITVPEGLQLVAKVQYDYACKNFFGNSIGAILPELQNYKIFNAPVKVSHAQSTGYVWVEYDGFNASGYPEVLNLNTYNNDGHSYRLQFDVKYIQK